MIPFEKSCSDSETTYTWIYDVFMYGIIIDEFSNTVHSCHCCESKKICRPFLIWKRLLPCKVWLIFFNNEIVTRLFFAQFFNAMGSIESLETFNQHRSFTIHDRLRSNSDWYNVFFRLGNWQSWRETLLELLILGSKSFADDHLCPLTNWCSRLVMILYRRTSFDRWSISGISFRIFLVVRVDWNFFPNYFTHSFPKLSAPPSPSECEKRICLFLFIWLYICLYW